MEDKKRTGTKMTKEICHGCTDPAAHVEPPLGWENHECEKEKHENAK